MAEQTALYVNDFDLGLLGFAVTGVSGWRDGWARKEQMVPLPGRAGVALLSVLSEVLVRELAVDGVLAAASLAALRTAEDQLHARLAAGLVELRFIDGPSRFLLARAVEILAVGVPPSLFNPYRQMTVRFQLFDPVAYDVARLTVALTSTTKSPCPLGGTPSSPVIKIQGAVTNPVLTYRNARGDTVGSMTFTIILAATDFLTVDCDLMTITKSVSGTVTNAIGTLSGGNFFALDPTDGDPDNGAYATLQLSGGSGEAQYRRGWA